MSTRKEDDPLGTAIAEGERASSLTNNLAFRSTTSEMLDESMAAIAKLAGDQTIPLEDKKNAILSEAMLLAATFDMCARLDTKTVEGSNAKYHRAVEEDFEQLTRPQYEGHVPLTDN